MQYDYFPCRALGRINFLQIIAVALNFQGVTSGRQHIFFPSGPVPRNGKFRQVNTLLASLP